MGNLPAETTSFVGRRREVSEARSLLGRARVLTFTGTAGVGKTRLALRVASEVGGSFPDGVWVADLGAVPPGARLAHAVLAAMGFDYIAAGPPTTVLARHLADKRLLLVLDNCEHLLASCAELVCSLLAAAPDLKILVTSRQALGVGGEFLLTVRPLPTPGPDHPASWNAIASYEAVQLFMERASAALGGDQLSEGDGMLVARLCRRLEGIPLAIERVAAMWRFLGPQQIHSRLDDLLGLDDRDSRARPSRHRNLRAAVGWSFDLCTPEEQRAWAVLSVFRDGFDLEAAEALLTEVVPEGGQVLALLSRLVDKSVLAAERCDGEMRYRLLHPIRQYGRSRLRGNGEETAVRDHYREYYQRLLASAEAEWFGPRQSEWFARLRRDRANVRSAIEHSLRGEHTEKETPAGLWIAVPPLLHGLGSVGLPGEGRHRLDGPLDRRPLPARTRARALYMDGRLALLRGDTAAAGARQAECRTLAQASGHPEAVAHAAQLDGLVALFQNNYSAALPKLEEAHDAHRATGYLRGQWTALFTLALGCCLSDHPRTTMLAEQCLNLCETHGAQVSRSSALLLLGLHSWRRGDNDRAIDILQDVLRLADSTGSPLSAAFCLEVLAWATAREGRREHAAVLLGAARTARHSAHVELSSLGPLLAYHRECRDHLLDALGEGPCVAAIEGGAALTPGQAAARVLGTPPVLSAIQPVHPAETLLSRREAHVAKLVSQGLSNKEIAAKLVISPRTAEGHVQRILNKLGLTRRTQIAAWALANSARRDGT
ncbi:ATP-binding protein [Streptomyces platensis]|uniref:ATP-binding protein n=1 Tax=Streptomyces platensis TaxID=58346 RepID=UPI001F2E143B|nr:LuxR C-terminal-related transcriptional regulator [Streptomyces platensis]MCF3144177.1 LuxR family transcriptional regulator [Streptomyces platensis]